MANVYDETPDGRQSDDVNMEVSIFRPTYRALTDDEKALHDEIKKKAGKLYALFCKVIPTPYASDTLTMDRVTYKEYARKDLESSVMWIVKALTL